MNWLPFMDALYAALTQTLEALCPEKPAPCNEIQHRFNLLSTDILLSFNGRCPRPSTEGWQSMFQALQSCLTTHFEFLMRNGVPLDRKVWDVFDTLIHEIRKLARKHAGGLWPSMSPFWDAVMLMAQRMNKECEAEFGNASMKTIYYFSGEYTVNNLKILQTIKSQKRGSESFKAALTIAISDMRFGIRLNAIVNEDPAIQRRNCERLRKWAEKKRQEIELAEGTFIPTLTSGLSCLLPKNAREAIAVVKKKHQDKSLKKQRYLVDTLVLLFGEEAIPYFDLDFFMQNSQNLTDKKGTFRILGSIGGPQAVEVLCGLFWMPILCEEALKIIEKLAIPTGVVGSPDERPGRLIEKIVRLLLDNLEQLKQQNRANRQLIERVTKKVRAYHKPI